MMKETLYLLQVQEGEGFPFEGLYYPTKKRLDIAIGQCLRNKKIYIDEENSLNTWKHHNQEVKKGASKDWLKVHKIRVFEMIKRVIV